MSFEEYTSLAISKLNPKFTLKYIFGCGSLLAFVYPSHLVLLRLFCDHGKESEPSLDETLMLILSTKKLATCITASCELVVEAPRVELGSRESTIELSTCLFPN